MSADRIAEIREWANEPDAPGGELMYRHAAKSVTLELLAALDGLVLEHTRQEEALRKIGSSRCYWINEGLHDPDDTCENQRSFDDFCDPCLARAALSPPPVASGGEQ